MKPIKIGTLVVVEGLDGLWMVAARGAPNFYWVQQNGQTVAFVKVVFDALYENGKLVKRGEPYSL